MSSITRLAFQLAFVLVALFNAPRVFAFNKERCGTLFPKSDDTHPPYYAPLYIITMVPSTTSYFLSLGPCAMYGNNSARSAFLEKSSQPLQVDAARGHGEYLEAMAQLSGCPQDQYATFAAQMQNQFATVFAPGTPSEVLSRIDQVLDSESSLRHSCGHTLN